MCTHPHPPLHTSTHTHIHPYPTYKHIHRHPPLHTHIHTNTHPYTHKYTYIHHYIQSHTHHTTPSHTFPQILKNALSLKSSAPFNMKLELPRVRGSGYSRADLRCQGESAGRRVPCLHSQTERLSSLVLGWHHISPDQ